MVFFDVFEPFEMNNQDLRDVFEISPTLVYKKYILLAIWSPLHLSQ